MTMREAGMNTRIEGPRRSTATPRWVGSWPGATPREAPPVGVDPGEAGALKQLAAGCPDEELTVVLAR